LDSNIGERGKREKEGNPFSLIPGEIVERR
jgi:hypothetical protein